jgi:enoyl-CoA hydratase/carnithine racemase
MSLTKALLNHAAYPNFAAQLAREAQYVARCAATQDFGRGIQATLSKKPAEFE